MIQQNIIADIGTWTKIPNKILTELVRKAEVCIGSALYDVKQTKEPVAVLQIGIGTLSVNMEDMQCKFIPSKELKTIIIGEIKKSKLKV